SKRCTNACPTKPDAPVTRKCSALLTISMGLGHQHRDTVRIGIMKAHLLSAEVPEPALHFLRCVLPGVMRMIPIEIDHVVGLIVEGLVPEALEKIVINEPLDIVRTSRDIQDGDRLGEANLGVEARELPA